MSSSTDRSHTDRIVWIDCEMTGLSLTDDALIEIAVLVTDFELNQLGDGVDIVIRPPQAALDQMNDFVRDMHTRSALLDELPGGTTMQDAQERALAYIREWVPEPRKAPLGGNTVGTDRAFLARDMPELEGYLHYRNVDVSTVKELARRWYPRVYFNAPEKHGGHRALGDIRDSIAELRYYREAVFVPQPGPDTPTAREISSHHGVHPAAERAEDGSAQATPAAPGGPREPGTPAGGPSLPISTEG